MCAKNLSDDNCVVYTAVLCYHGNKHNVFDLYRQLDGCVKLKVIPLPPAHTHTSFGEFCQCDQTGQTGAGQTLDCP